MPSPASVEQAHDAARRAALACRPASQASVLRRFAVWLPYRVHAASVGSRATWLEAARLRAVRARLSWAASAVGAAERALARDDAHRVAAGLRALLPPVLHEGLLVCLRDSPAFTMDGLYLAPVLGFPLSAAPSKDEVARLEARLRRLAAAYVCRHVAWVDPENALDPHPAAGCPVGEWSVVHTDPVGVVGGRRWWRAIMYRFVAHALRYDEVTGGFVVREGATVAAGRTRQEALAVLDAARRASAAALL